MAKGKYQKWLEPEGLTLLRGWARAGLTDEKIANKMDISTSTLYEWKKKYSEISDTLKKNKELYDNGVIDSLYREIEGYEYKETIKERDPETGKLVVVKEIIKYARPNITAIIFWLKNRIPKDWREKIENMNINKDDKEIIINIMGMGKQKENEKNE